MTASRLPELVVRADADAQIASGHAMRGLALALEWTRRGGKARFCGRLESAGWKERFLQAGVPLSLPGADGLPVLEGRPWLFLDGYGFGPELLARAREKARTLVVDDHGHRPRIHGDVLLNQNLGAETRAYETDADTLPLLGPRFALLRPEFAGRPERLFEGRADKILITLGGADAENLTARVVEALPEGAQCVAVLGAAYAHPEPKRAGLRCVRDVKNMGELMAWADVGVIAGGATAWEACFTGLPCVVLTLADNQRDGAAALETSGAAIRAGAGPKVGREELADALEKLTADAALRRAVSLKAAALVDGKGASRVVDAMLALGAERLAEADIRVRAVAAEDALDVWRLASEPAVRAQSFRKEPIPLGDHMSWFRGQLADGKTSFWALEAGGTLAAQVRYAREDDGAAEVHFSVRGAFRGKGLGTKALQLTGERAGRALNARLLRGVVIIPNPASERAFEKAGFTRSGEKTIRGLRCAVFEKPCS
jgi:UDP-2,4-diacetamido-2,4,6-trideoxy-beta-L-altropyranose hydrolase